MKDHIAEINHDPTVAGIALFFAFSFVFNADFINCSIGEGVEHAVACAGANDKIIGKGSYIFDVHQDDVFAFFVFKRINDITCKVQCIQVLSLIHIYIPEALMHFGKLIKKGKHLEEVIGNLTESLYRYPVEVSIWQALGDAYMRENRLKEALEAYNKAEELIR